MVQRVADTIVIDDTDQDLRQVLVDLGLPPGVGEDRSLHLAPELARLRSQLIELQSHPANRVDARASAVIGNFHFPLDKTIYFAFVATVKALGATLALLTNPTAGGIAMAIVVLDLAEKAQQLISRLDDRELGVLTALGAAIQQQQADDPHAGSVTLQQVEAALAEHRDIRAGLAGTLQAMSDPDDRRGVRRLEQGGVMRYAVVA